MGTSRFFSQDSPSWQKSTGHLHITYDGESWRYVVFNLIPSFVLIWDKYWYDDYNLSDWPILSSLKGVIKWKYQYGMGICNYAIEIV